MNKSKRKIVLTVPVETARILYTILKYAPAIEKTIMDEKTKSGITFRKFTDGERKKLLELYDDLAIKLSMEAWS